jgi:hypothetical protein
VKCIAFVFSFVTNEVECLSFLLGIFIIETSQSLVNIEIKFQASIRQMKATLDKFQLDLSKNDRHSTLNHFYATKTRLKMSFFGAGG